MKFNVYNMINMFEQADIDLNLLIQIEFKYPEVWTLNSNE